MSSVEVYHELTGSPDAPVLVLAGPLGSTLDIWQPHVESLATKFQVLRYDHRGMVVLQSSTAPTRSRT
jgi:pimeloyl-ACP methyl ester carboxylesterase